MCGRVAASCPTADASCCKVGDAKVAIVHGDAWSLAGWNFSHDMLDNADHRPQLERFAPRRAIDIFASTHTCLAALRNFSTPDGDLTVINNGAAGMPNFRNSNFGLMSRIATQPSPHLRLYGSVQDGVHIDAIPLEYDNSCLLRHFWTAGRTDRRRMNPISGASRPGQTTTLSKRSPAPDADTVDRSASPR